MKNKKGFTLIELLAVIIILGVLMIIAIPSVTKYIEDSRKNGYVSTVKGIANGARNLVYSGSLDFSDKNTTYYIPAEYIDTENGSKTPYGELEEAYIGIIYSNEGHRYYWISRDSSGKGISKITPIENLEIDNLESDILSNEITNIARTVGIGNRTNIKILNSSNSWETIELSNIDNNVTEEGNTPIQIIYPAGKNKNTVVVGDVVTIDTENFNVLKRVGNDLYLFAQYNLNVGPRPYGTPKVRQNANVLGWDSATSNDYGCVAFSETPYWNNKVGSKYPGTYCANYPFPEIGCAYVYDDNSSIYQYVNSYKLYLESIGVYAKEARLLNMDEAIELGCFNTGLLSCSSPSWFYKAGFWLGTAFDDDELWGIDTDGDIYNNNYDDIWLFGVRPLIII